MKTLLIDNHSSLTRKLANLMPRDEEIVDYTAITDELDDFPLIVLSGSSEFPIHGNEARCIKETQLIRDRHLSLVGICLGHELIAHAFGADIERMNHCHTGIVTIEVVSDDPLFQGHNTFPAYGNHLYGVCELPNDFEALAKTDHAIAMFKHVKRPMYGMQFTQSILSMNNLVTRFL